MKPKKTLSSVSNLLCSTILGGVAAVSESEDDDTLLWHMRLRHMSERGMRELHKRNLLAGIRSCKLDFCKYCVMGKQYRVFFKTATHNTKGKLDYVHSDIWGPVRVASKGGGQYFMSFIDDYSRKVWVYFLKNKSDAFATFKKWKAEVENQTARKLKCLRTDNGTESKLDPKSKKCIFLDYEKGVKEYKFWDPVAQKVVINRDVEFDELESQPEEESHGNDEKLDNTKTERPKRNKRPPIRYGFEDLVSYALLTSSKDPSTFQEAIDSSENDKWMEVMVEEMESLSKNKTWELTKLPKRKETYRLQVGIQKEGSNIGKGRGKIQGTISSKGIFTEAWPDLAHAVSTISSYMANPGREHWNAVKWIFRYLKGTAEHGILFSRQSGTNSVIGYVDADYAGDVDDRRSTTEAEYMAVAEAAKEALWLKGLVKEFGLNQSRVQMHCDSQSAIYLAKNQVYHARTKHIDVRFHKIRELIVTGDIVLEKVHTSENAADMLTKPITTSKFKHCLDLINLPFPVDCLYADPERKAYDILGLYYGFGRTFFNPASAKVFSRFESLRKAAKNYTIRATPDDRSSVLQQGGMFVFKGKELLYARKDEGTGDHAPLDDIFDVCCKVPVA
uniref:Uncharacterized protein n=1 Tax=Fagus sylvatica TaxID=28930 RepID=A0A2N9G064_FAGSY